MDNLDQKNLAKLNSKVLINLDLRLKANESWIIDKIISTNKDILLVGDRSGPKAPQTDLYHHTPFFGLTYSGGWLNKLLVNYDIPEDRLFWFNSASWDNKTSSSEILSVKEWPYVFALGNNAATWLSKNKVKHIKVLHPQAHKRFNSSEKYLLMEKLAELHYSQNGRLASC